MTHSMNYRHSLIPVVKIEHFAKMSYKRFKIQLAELLFYSCIALIHRLLFRAHRLLNRDFSFLFRFNGLIIRAHELSFHELGILFRLHELLFHLHELLFRKHGLLFRLHELLFRLHKILFR